MTRAWRLPGVVVGALFLYTMLVSAICGCQTEQTASSDSAQTVNANPNRAAVEVECDVDLGLTKASGIKIDWMDEERIWSVAIDDGQFTLTRHGSCGDECGFVEEISLASADGECPEFVSARRVYHEYMSAKGPSERETRATEGTLEIQDWDVERGIISGKLTSEVEFTFYAVLEK